MRLSTTPYPQPCVYRTDQKIHLRDCDSSADDELAVLKILAKAAGAEARMGGGRSGNRGEAGVSSSCLRRWSVSDEAGDSLAVRLRFEEAGLLLDFGNCDWLSICDAASSFPTIKTVLVLMLQAALRYGNAKKKQGRSCPPCLLF